MLKLLLLQQGLQLWNKHNENMNSEFEKKGYGSINLNFGIVPSNGKEFSLLESFNRNVANNKAAIIK